MSRPFTVRNSRAVTPFKDRQMSTDMQRRNANVIKEDNITRGMWRLGRVAKLNKGDDYIRTAKIYLSNSRYIQRSISPLHP